MADVKITQLPAASGVTADDLVPIVNDPAGTPTTQKATWAQALAYVQGAITIAQAQVTGLVAALAGKLAAASNLSDLANTGTARTNLGLGTAATQNKVAAGVVGVLDATDPTTTNSRAPNGGAGGVLGGSYPNPSFAVDMATQAELDTEASTRASADTTNANNLTTHEADTTNVHGIADTANLLTIAAAAAAYQPLDSDLTAIAALSTTAFGRALLTLADAAALRTAGELGSLATLNSVTASLISDASANGRSLITAADYAAMRSLLSLGALALKNTAATADIDNDAVTFAKIQNIATDRLLGRDTASSGDPEELTVGGGVEFSGSGGIQRSALTGDVTASAGSNATTIPNNTVTYAKMQDISATSRILGRVSSGAGDTEELTGAQVLSITGAQTAIAEGRPTDGVTPQLSLPGIEISAVSTAALLANTIYYEPILVPTTITIDQLAATVSTAGAAATTARLGLYNANSNWQPTTLVVDAGTVAVDSTGAKTASVNQTLQPGRYLLAITSDGTPTLRVLRGGNRLAGYRVASAAGLCVAELQAAVAYAAFAGTGVAWTTVVYAANPFDHHLWLRVSVP